MPSQPLFSQCALIILLVMKNLTEKKGGKGRKEGQEGGKEGKNKGEIKEMKGKIIKEQKREEKKRKGEKGYINSSSAPLES